MVHSFLLIGQSNMAGRGFINEAHPIDIERLYVLRNGRWIQMFRPVHSDRKTAGVCLGESFAEAYCKENNVDVGLIACADGGTRIEQWERGDVLYDNAVFQAKLAMRTSTLKGILWHQGESNCHATQDSTTYKAQLEALIANLRRDLGEDIPFICGGMGDFMGTFHQSDNYLIINKAFQEVANEQKLVGYAKADGLKPNADNLHFSADALYDFGLRYYKEFKKINPKVQVENSTAKLEFSDMEKL